MDMGVVEGDHTMTTQPVIDTSSLIEATDAAHRGALAAMDDGRYLDAVVWLSAHAAAMQRSVHRTARHSRAMAELRAADRGLETVLRRVEQHFAGDVLAAQINESELDGSLRRAFELHCRTEKALLDELAETMSREQLAALAAAYADALRRAPTRPHPHVPHSGVLGAVAFRVDAWRDKMMDTMDGRHVPSPRHISPRKAPGRWGRYLLGEMERKPPS
jgi:hypothetical protein